MEAPDPLRLRDAFANCRLSIISIYLRRSLSTPTRQSFFISNYLHSSPKSPMATVITIPPSTAAGPATASTYTPSHHPSPDHLRRRAQTTSTPTSNLSPSPISNNSTLPRVQGRDGASCDACLRRKSRCAMNEMVNKCYSCDFHRQECTFTLSAGPEAPTKKRKLDDSPKSVESVKRYGSGAAGWWPSIQKEY